MEVGALEVLRRRLLAGEAVVAGVLSGTSGDGIDVALVRPHPAGEAASGPPRVLAFETLPFAPEVAGRVRSVLDGERLGLRETALLSRDLGRAFGSAVRELAQARGLEIDLVGSHGQTVYHHDGSEPSGPATLQLGDGDFVAEACGACVVSDFRARDVAAGGEGAPLSALADEEIFAAVPRPALVLNLGGMANLTWMGAAGELLSFDTGPAGALLDGLARRFLGRPYDPDGATARAGRASEALITEWLAHPFLRRAPPKSTGRDTFGEAWVEGAIASARRAGVLHSERGPEDLFASAAEFVARAAVQGARDFAPGGATWLVACGGGVSNQRVLSALALHSPWPVATSADFGVHPDGREALVFALLAVRALLGVPSTSPSATGARAGRVLGKISPAANA